MLGYLIHLLTDKLYNEYFFKYFYIYDEDDEGIAQFFSGQKDDLKNEKNINFFRREFRI